LGTLYSIAALKIFTVYLLSLAWTRARHVFITVITSDNKCYKHFVILGRFIFSDYYLS